MNIKNMHVVDQFGHIKAQIADLEEQEKALRQQILALGEKEVEGDLFRAVVSVSARDGRDAAFKAKIEELIEEHLSAQYVRAHTTSTDITTVRVSARKGVKLQVAGD
jgi:Cdc6-like AAA superfamily ATPase